MEIVNRDGFLANVLDIEGGKLRITDIVISGGKRQFELTKVSNFGGKCDFKAAVLERKEEAVPIQKNPPMDG